MISLYEDRIQIELSQNVFLKGYEISLSSYFEALSRNIQGSLEHVFVLAYMYMKYDMSEYVYKSITNYEVWYNLDSESASHLPWLNLSQVVQVGWKLEEEGLLISQVVREYVWA